MTLEFDVCRAAEDMAQFVPQYLIDLERLANIDSGTLDKVGVDLVGTHLRAQYAELGGLIDVLPQREFGDNFVVRFTGHGVGRVLLLGHTDTVYPSGTTKHRPFRVSGDHATGPGTADMKAGDLSIVYALRLLSHQGFTSYASTTVVHNTDEEMGSPESKTLIRHHAEGADAVLVLEAGRENGDIVSGRKGIVSFELSVSGRSAHAGVNHDRGRSAGLELAHMVVALEALNGRVPGVTLNVGRIEAGGAVNVVPDSGFARVEARAYTLDRLQEIVGLVEEVVARRVVPDTSVTLHHSIEHFPMHKSEGSAKLVLRAQELAGALGYDVRDTVTGGASDGNTAAATGRPVLDGLGPVGGGAHSEREYVNIPSIAPRTAALAGLIASIGSQGLD